MALTERECSPEHDSVKEHLETYEDHKVLSKYHCIPKKREYSAENWRGHLSYSQSHHSGCAAQEQTQKLFTIQKENPMKNTYQGVKLLCRSSPLESSNLIDSALKKHNLPSVPNQHH